MILECDLCCRRIDSVEFNKKYGDIMRTNVSIFPAPVLCDICLESIRKIYFQEDADTKDVKIDCTTEDILKQIAELRAQISTISLELETAKMRTLITNC